MMRHTPIDPGLGSGEPGCPGGRAQARGHMSAPVVVISAAASAAEAWSLMQARGVRHLPVVDGRGRLVAMLTDRDLRRLVLNTGDGRPRRDILTALETVPAIMAATGDVVTVGPETEIAEVARIMHVCEIGAVPVVDGDFVIGILTRTDIVAAMLTGPAAGPRRSPGEESGRLGAA
jgi:acetoin utilization protein AcuB